MSGRECQLLLSPCNVSPSLSMMGAHRASPQRANLGSCVGADTMKPRLNGSFASESQNGSQVVLPSLCLRRQVLTSGKDGSVPGQPAHQQVPAHHGLIVVAAGAAGRAGPRSSKGTSLKTSHHLTALAVSVSRGAFQDGAHS